MPLRQIAWSGENARPGGYITQFVQHAVIFGCVSFPPAHPRVPIPRADRLLIMQLVVNRGEPVCF